MPEIATFDHYEVLTRDDGSLFELGRGAMGVTYKAFDTSLRFPVCLKVINAAYLNSDVARQRFIREARSAAKLRHRNVASVFHLGTEGDTWFYAMEFIDGETLEAVIKREGTLAPKVALEITAQVARALNAATQHGLVHRDIKPANLMLVQEDDEVIAKVIDFGLAKTSLGEGEDMATLSMGGFVGTPHFASPEQLEEREIDVRSDIYSLGVTLWYMLAGQPPFGGSMAQVMSQHLSKPPPFDKFKTLPPAVGDLLRKMLEKDPANRFQTPAELRKSIEDVLSKLSHTHAAEAPSEAPVDQEDFATLLETASKRPGETRFETGVTIAGRYRITEALGETNAGRVFRAEDHAQKREVRLLVLHKEFLNDSAVITSLEREVERLAQVQHPNLLGVFDFATIENASFLAMEWTSGFSLLELLRARREVDAGEAILLLKQAAAGVDYALRRGLNGLEFGLHQVMIHFPEPFEKDALLHQPISNWPAFTLKLYPLGVTRDLTSSQTWAGGQTVVGGGAQNVSGGADDRGRYIRSLAAIIYELLGGTLSPLMQSGAGLAPSRYTPLSTLSEEGNEVLKHALDPAYSFPGAQEFCTALAKIDGVQLARRESAPAVSKYKSTPPLPPPVVIPPAPRPIPPAPKKSKAPLIIVGSIAILVLGGGVAHYASHGGSSHENSTPVPITPGPITPAPITPLNITPTPITPTPRPITPTPTPKPPPPTPDPTMALKAAVEAAEKKEAEDDTRGALRGYLDVMDKFPETGVSVGRNHLETLLGFLRKDEIPMKRDRFIELEDLIREAAQKEVIGAMLLLGENLRLSSPRESFDWSQKAANTGSAAGINQLGLALAAGVPDYQKPDLKRSVDCFREAAAKGHPSAKYFLAECYMDGKGVEKDEKAGIELLREAIAAKNPRAMNKLGAYLTRRDTSRPDTQRKAEFDEAFKLFSEAHKLGFLDALANQGIMYLNGQAPGARGPNYTEAASLFLQGARKFNPLCMRMYALCLEDGMGVSKNPMLASYWYARSAKEGDRIAVEWCKKHNLDYTVEIPPPDHYKP